MKKPTSSRFFFCLFLLFSASSKLNRKRAKGEKTNQSKRRKTALSLEIPLTETAPRERNKREIFKSALVNISICFNLSSVLLARLLSARPARFSVQKSLSLCKIFMRRKERFSSSVPAAFLFFVRFIHLHPK
jgi:hypothetical protein